MFQLLTRHKIALAAALSRGVIGTRHVFGLSSRTEARRKGITWDLDLSEGIDFSIYLLGEFEPTTVRACGRLVSPGSVVVDIGANVGAHVLQLARMVGEAGRVLAFEPTDYAFGKLLRNLELNPVLAARVDPRQVFLGVCEPVDAAGVSPLYSSWPLSPGADLHLQHGGRRMPVTGARHACLDAEVGDAEVRVIKMDVDGHECGVLRGAERLLRRCRPTLVMELSPYQLEEMGSSVAELVQILAQARYRLTDLGGAREVTMDPQKLQREIPPGSSRNVLAVPLR